MSEYNVNLAEKLLDAVSVDDRQQALRLIEELELAILVDEAMAVAGIKVPQRGSIETT